MTTHATKIARHPPRPATTTSLRAVAKSYQTDSSSPSIWLNALCGGIAVGVPLLLRSQDQSWLISILVGVPIAFVVLLLGFLLVGRLRRKQ